LARCAGLRHESARCRIERIENGQKSPQQVQTLPDLLAFEGEPRVITSCENPENAAAAP